MKNVLRITIFVIILIGGTLSFGYWALKSFDKTFSSIDRSNELYYSSLASRLKSEIPPINLEASAVASVSSEPLASDNISTTVASDTQNTNNSQETNFAFTFPTKGSNVSEGCQYNITWTSALPVNAIDFSLIDAGTLQATGPIASGLPKNVAENNMKNFIWKVGNVWPGEYYILASNINSQNENKKSSHFFINKIPEGADLKTACSQ
jgi:hypothetical protein